MNTETISDNENTEQTEAETVLGSMPDFEDFKEGEEAKKELANILDELNYSEELRDVLENVVPAIAEFYNDYEKRCCFGLFRLWVSPFGISLLSYLLFRSSCKLFAIFCSFIGACWHNNAYLFES